MALTLPATALKPRYGSNVYFAIEGDTVETVTVAVDAKPAGSVLTDWETIGCLSDGSLEVISSGGEAVECWSATLMDWVMEQTEQEDATTRLNGSLTFERVTPFVLQMAMAAASVNGTTGAFTPGSQRGGAFKGWLKVEMGRVGVGDVIELFLWCQIRLTNPLPVSRKDPGYSPQIEVMGLGSALDAGVLGVVS